MSRVIHVTVVDAEARGVYDALLRHPGALAPARIDGRGGSAPNGVRDAVLYFGVNLFIRFV